MARNRLQLKTKQGGIETLATFDTGYKNKRTMASYLIGNLFNSCRLFINKKPFEIMYSKLFSYLRAFLLNIFHWFFHSLVH